MKTKILPGIAMLMTLIIISCTSTQTDPYKGLVKIKSSYYLVVCDKIIPVDSGISYSNALDAYNHPNQICPAEARIKKVNWEVEIKQDAYVVYDREKIFVMLGKKHEKSSLIKEIITFVSFVSVALALAIFLSSIPLWTSRPPKS